MSSKQFEQLYNVFRAYPLLPEAGLETLRTAYNDMSVGFKLPEDATFEEIDINGVRAEWSIVPESEESRVLLYLHGGGYIMGTTKMYREMTTKLARVGGVSVLSVDYRLAPENQFPAGLNDAITAYKWLLSQVYSTERIILAGDSAGAGLVLATLLKIRSLGLRMPTTAICISPLTDLAQTGKSIKENAAIDPVMSYELIKFCADCYVGEEGDRCNPFVSPFYADLTGLPPLLIMVGEREILLDDAMRFTKKAEFFGVETTLVVAQEMTHIWPFFSSILPEGRQAIKYIGDYIHKFV